MRRLVIEIPLAQRMRPEEAAKHAQALLLLLQRALDPATNVPRGPYADFRTWSVRGELVPRR